MGLVIMIHAMDTMKQEGGLTGDIIRSGLTSLIMICNPLFFMMSGHFNLHFKGSTKSDYVKYYMKKVSSILIPLIVYQLFFYVVTSYLYSDFHGFKEYILGFIINIIQDYTTTYFWFMYVLIGFLIAAPFLSKMLDTLSSKEQLIFAQIFIAIQVVNWICILMGFHLGVVYIFSGWLMYFLLGRLLENQKQLSTIIQAVIFFGVICLNAFLTIKTPHSRDWGLYDLSPFYILLSVTLYLALLNSPIVLQFAQKKFFKFLAQQSYSIYLVHGAILAALGLVIRIKQPIVQVVMLFISVYAGALVLSWIIDLLVIKPIQKFYRKKIIYRI